MSLDAFRASFGHARSLTYDFIAAVPDAHWQFTPHPRFAPLCKQFRHIVCVQGVYIDGIQRRAADFARKHSHYAGPLDRDSLVTALREKDNLLTRVLDEVEPQQDDYTIEFYGTQTLASYLNAVLHHEALHHGQWSLYAAFASFETPESWKLNWGL